MINEHLIALSMLAVPTAFFLLRAVHFYVLKALGRPAPIDQEMLQRGESMLLGQGPRQLFAWSMGPVYRLLERSRIHPNFLTVSCLVVSLVAGVLIALGELVLGGVVGLLGSSLDFLDGRVARNTGRTSRAGAFLDSTLDRDCDIAFLGGAAVYFRDSVWILLACLLGMGSALVISYTRAKAESLGVDLKVGLMQRPERVVMFCGGATFSPFVDAWLPAHLAGNQYLFAGALVVLAVLTTLTSVQRTLKGFRLLLAQDHEVTGKDG